MDVTLAAQRAVSAWPHGSAALAEAMGMARSSLLHKVSPQYAGAHLSPEELQRLMLITGDRGPLVALADALGMVCIPVAGGLADESGCSLAAVGLATREFGELVGQVAASLADGSVTLNELARIEDEGRQAMAAIHDLLAHVQAVYRAGLPERDRLGSVRPLRAVQGGG